MASPSRSVLSSRSLSSSATSPDDLGHVAAGDVVGEIRVAENFLDQNQLILHLGREIALPDLARFAQDTGIEGEKARVERGQNLVVGQAQQ